MRQLHMALPTLSHSLEAVVDVVQHVAERALREGEGLRRDALGHPMIDRDVSGDLQLGAHHVLPDGVQLGVERRIVSLRQQIRRSRGQIGLPHDVAN